MSKPNPLVSVVTVSYNQAPYLEQTLDCIQEQDYPNIEHIVIDAVSTDGSVDILKNYKGISWVSEPDKGQSEGLNKGFKKAHGDIITWLNSDDLLADNHTISRVVEYFHTHPKVDVMYGHALYIDEHNAVTGAIITADIPQTQLKYRNNIIAQPSTFFRASVFEEVGYIDESLHYAMDYEFWLRLAEKVKFEFVPHIFSLARITPETKTGSGSKEFWKEAWEIHRKYTNAPLRSHFRYVWLHERYIQPVSRRYMGVIRRIFKF